MIKNRIFSALAIAALVSVAACEAEEEAPIVEEPAAEEVVTEPIVEEPVAETDTLIIDENANVEVEAEGHEGM